MQFVIDASHPALPGHFPGNPVVPGVVVLDRVLAAVEAVSGAAVGALRLPQVKFLRPLLPGEVADIAVEAVAGADGAAPRWKFRVACGGDTVATGEVAPA